MQQSHKLEFDHCGKAKVSKVNYVCLVSKCKVSLTKDIYTYFNDYHDDIKMLKETAVDLPVNK